MAEYKENNIEWITGEDTVYATISQLGFIRKFKNISKKYPDKVVILAENKDGSVLIKAPLAAIKINLNYKFFDEEQKEQLRITAEKARIAKLNKTK